MSIDAQVRTIPGTQQAVATSGGHSVVVDRPDGVAGGTGAGLNGGQLLALAIGGCLANDVRYASTDLGLPVDEVEVDVSLDVADGVVTSASVRLHATAPDGADTSAVVDEALGISTVLAAVRSGFPVEVSRG